MVVTPLRVIIFLAAAIVAALGTAYFTGAMDRYLGEPSALAKVETDGSANDKSGRLSGGGETAPTEVAPTDSEATAPVDKVSPESAGTEAAHAEIIVPAFDIVRVEPDGSMVVAGRAAPGSHIEVVSGSTIIGKAVTNDTGDFAVVLDKPLDPGDYQIVLRSTAPGNIVATSKETAVVSIPDNRNGEVLALVEEPGKPSRLITVPKAKPAGKLSEEQMAAAENAAASGQGLGKAESVAGPAESAAAGTDSQPAAGAGKADTGNDAGRKAASAGAGSGDEDGTQAADSGGNAASGKPASEAKVYIEAVEIDGKQVFVAGGGLPGQHVRLYANDILLGEAEVSPSGRFLVEATRDLPVGDYIVRADLLSDNGSEVVARAAVPFERQPGEKLSAVAPRGDAAPDSAGSSEAGNRAAASADDAGTGMAGSQPAGDAAGQSARSAAASAGEGDGGSGGKGGMVLPDLHSGIAAGTPVVTEPKLEAVDGAVIIRRGDTLWQISRRVYGRGIRYSTIYLANQDQIEDPDLIWPGQVFSVPETTGEGETADLSAIGDQAVPLSEKTKQN